MTNEEAIAYFKRHIDLYCVDGICREAEETAIKALERQPCDDAISRKKVEKITWDEPSYTDALNVLTEVRDKVRALPSVTRQAGEWIHIGGDEWICSKCGEVITTEGSWDKPTDKYCKECGAKMQEDEE